MNPRPILVFAGITAAMAAIAAFAYAQPFWGDEAPSAEATPTAIGACNVSVSDVPQGVKATILSLPRPPGYSNTPLEGQSIYLLLWIPRDGPLPTKNPETGSAPYPSSLVYINAKTGEIEFENYNNRDDEAMLEVALDSLKVGPWTPDYDAWPRTNTPPKKDVRVFDENSPINIKFRPSDAGAGMASSFPIGDRGGVLRVFTCDSVVEIDGRTGEVLRKDVVPGEQQMFARFISEVQLASGKAGSS